MNITESEFSLPRKILGWFSGPHLPASISLLALGASATHAAMLLAIQPSAYWLDPRMVLRPSILDWFTAGWLTSGPWFFIAAVLLYMLAAGLLLTRLNRSAALVLAGMLCFYHIYSIRVLYPRASITFQLGIAIVLILVFLLVFIKAGHWSLAPLRWQQLPLMLAGAWLVFLIVMIARSTVIPSTGWQPLVPQQMPSARYGMAVAYDTRRERTVLFGGMMINKRNQYVYSAETWEWDGKEWMKVQTDDSPSGRQFSSMAYDESRGVVVLYGGENLNGTLADLWEYDGRQWKWLCPSCNPASRRGATMVYDPVREHVVFYGGVGPGMKGEDVWYSEAWAWNGINWEFQEIFSSSPSTFNPALIYDNEQQRIMTFIDLNYGGTWFWKDGFWIRPDLVPEPPHSKSARMIYDPVYKRILLFGGIRQIITSPYIQTNKLMNETWVYENDAWRLLSTPLSPPARQDHIAFYDPTRQSMIVFGGRTEKAPLSDMWELLLSNPLPGEIAKEVQ